MNQLTPVVYVVDDDVSVRESLAGLFASVGLRCEAFDSGKAFLARPRNLCPGCLVLDVRLPDISGLELQEHLASDQFAIPVIFVTAFGDIPMTVRAMKAGAIEFLIKPLDDRTLVETVRQAIRRSDLALDREERLRTLRARHDSLSRREREVMALVVTGLLNKQVGGELGISEITVKAHRGNMMRKMGASSLVHLVAMAGMLHDSPVLGNQQSMDDRVMARSFGSQ